MAYPFSVCLCAGLTSLAVIRASHGDNMGHPESKGQVHYRCYYRNKGQKKHCIERARAPAQANFEQWQIVLRNVF